MHRTGAEVYNSERKWKRVDANGKAQEVKRKRRETDASRAEEETHGGHLPGNGDERMRGRRQCIKDQKMKIERGGNYGITSFNYG